MIKIDELADAWIALQTVTKTERDALFWAHERLDDLVRDDPEVAWQIIDLIWRREPSDAILAKLAAGPVEDGVGVRGGDGEDDGRPHVVLRRDVRSRIDAVLRVLSGGG